jgi:asparagine synthase (glutamine-hydrolysing)
MCGLAGFFSPESVTADDSRTRLKAMTDAVMHRGPDGDGFWSDSAEGIHLGHRRLAIVDLSPAGAQPMLSATGRFVIAFNGEIYNHIELRHELDRAVSVPTANSTAVAQPPAWRGHSDTETLLAGFEAWGVVPTLQRAVGMWAFVLWDRQQKTLTLCRDRLGEKPLYFGYAGNTFLFASELKAIRMHPSFAQASPTLSDAAVRAFMKYSYVPTPMCIYQGFAKLAPGTTLTLPLAALHGKQCDVHEIASHRWWGNAHEACGSQSGSSDGGDEKAATGPKPIAYWSITAAAQRGRDEPFSGSFDDAVDELDRLLKQSIRLQLMADVPVGAFLSGGVDSSAVVAIAQSISSRPVKTFSIGFTDPRYDEAPFAMAVARHLGTEHTELYVSPEMAMDVIPKLATLYDEPFADSSQIPTYLVSQLARQHVTVSLSGDAGDELFLGYNRYVVAEKLWGKIGRVPMVLRRGFAAAMNSVPAGAWNAVYRPTAALLPASWRMQLPGDKAQKLASILGLPDAAAVYERLVSTGDERILFSLPQGQRLRPEADAPQRAHAHLPTRFAIEDLQTYLPDDILTKVDRASMAVSLESRVPMLDHRIVEFALSLPPEYKLSGGHTKRVLRELLYRYVPRNLIERPKMGFGIPVGEWINGPIKARSDSIFARIHEPVQGAVQTLLAEHRSGKKNQVGPLWNALMFSAWEESISRRKP